MKTVAGPVTAAERRQAELQDLDRARLQRIGIAQARKIGDRAQRAVLRSAGNPDKAVQALRRELAAMGDVVRQGMLTAHLAGRRRAQLISPVKPSLTLYGQRGPYDKALRFLRERLAMTPMQLLKIEAQYDAAAVRVVKEASDAVEKRLQEAIYEATQKGMHVREGKALLGKAARIPHAGKKAAIREAFAKSGLGPGNSFTLEAIFRTQTQLAYGGGQYQADQDPAIQEILWGYKYVTVGDDRVRGEHVGFDGVTLPKADLFWQTHWPPNGWACRCAVISIFEPREVVKVPAFVDVDGREVRPEVAKGFRFNPGEVFAGTV